MKTEHDLIDMAHSNAEAAIDQKKEYKDSVSAYAQNVKDTLMEWRQSGKDNRILAVYYARVAELLGAM